MPKYRFVPKVLAGCQSFGLEFWQGKNVPKVSAQNFMPKFRAEILSQNFGTVPKLSARNFGLKHFGMKFRHEKYDEIPCRNFRLKRPFRHEDE